MKIRHAAFTTPTGIREDFFSAEGAVKNTFREEASELIAAYDAELLRAGCSANTEMLLRIHLSDPTNQIAVLDELLADRKSFISVIGQAPVDNRRIAIEAWHWHCTDRKKDENSLQLQLKNYLVCWFRQNNIESAGSYDQTYEAFAGLKDFLTTCSANTADHTVRTWLYCRDVDNNYAGLVQARNRFFDENGLTRDTHFIASTGIEGQMADVKQLVMMDSINYPALQPGQMQYLYALENLSPTAIYGVSFERGTRLILGDRSHYFISGTASIDKEGIVMHNFDVAKQTHRVLDNIEALLQEGEGSLDDIVLGTLYLRDAADADICRKIISDRLQREIPLVTVKAPVCRPAWLVEIECIAVNSKGSSKFPPLA